MKNLKIKFGLFSLLAVLAASVFLTSCEQESLILPTDENLPEIVEKQLEVSQQVWNNAFSDKLTYVSHEYMGNIKDKATRAEVVKSITDEAKLVAYGNINQPETVIVEVLEEATEKAVTTRQNLRTYVADEIEVNNHVIAIKWNKGGEIFTTYCVANADGIVWDNVLGGVFSMDEAGNEEYSSDYARAASKWYKRWWTVSWIWGSHRGEMGYKITIYYNGNHVSNVDPEDWADMDAGNEKSESKIIKNSGSYGKIKYALGLSTPTVSLSFSYNNFSVSSSGIGSSRVRNGYKSLYP